MYDDGNIEVVLMVWVKGCLRIGYMYLRNFRDIGLTIGIRKREGYVQG